MSIEGKKSGHFRLDIVFWTGILTIERSKINSSVNKDGDGDHSKTYHGYQHHNAGNSQPGI